MAATEADDGEMAGEKRDGRRPLRRRVEKRQQQQGRPRLLAIAAAQFDELRAEAHTRRGTSGDDEAPATTKPERTTGTECSSEAIGDRVAEIISAAPAGADKP